MIRQENIPCFVVIMAMPHVTIKEIKTISLKAVVLEASVRDIDTS